MWEKVDELMVDNWMEKLVRDSRCNNNVTRLLCVCVCVMTHASNVFVFLTRHLIGKNLLLLFILFSPGCYFIRVSARTV